MGSIFRKKSSPRLHWRDSYNHGNRHLQLPLPQSLTVWSSGVRENTAVGTWILLVAGTTWLCKVVPAAVWTLCCSKVALALPAHQAPNDQHYPSKALEALAMDFTQFEWSSDGRVCYCSHQCIHKVYVLSATGYQPTSTVVKTLVCDCFLVYGVHNHIHSDQGSCIAAEVMRGTVRHLWR